MNQTEDILSRGLEHHDYTLYRKCAPSRFTRKVLYNWQTKLLRNGIAIIGQLKDGTAIQTSKIVRAESPRLVYTASSCYFLDTTSAASRSTLNRATASQSTEKQSPMFVNGFPADWKKVVAQEIERRCKEKDCEDESDDSLIVKGDEDVQEHVNASFNLESLRSMLGDDREEKDELDLRRKDEKSSSIFSLGADEKGGSIFSLGADEKSSGIFGLGDSNEVHKNKSLVEPQGSYPNYAPNPNRAPLGLFGESNFFYGGVTGKAEPSAATKKYSGSKSSLFDNKNIFKSLHKSINTDNYLRRMDQGYEESSEAIQGAMDGMLGNTDRHQSNVDRNLSGIDRHQGNVDRNLSSIDRHQSNVDRSGLFRALRDAHFANAYMRSANNTQNEHETHEWREIGDFTAKNVKNEGDGHSKWAGRNTADMYNHPSGRQETKYGVNGALYSNNKNKQAYVDGSYFPVRDKEANSSYLEGPRLGAARDSGHSRDFINYSRDAVDQLGKDPGHLRNTTVHPKDVIASGEYEGRMSVRDPVAHRGAGSMPGFIHNTKKWNFTDQNTTPERRKDDGALPGDTHDLKAMRTYFGVDDSEGRRHSELRGAVKFLNGLTCKKSALEMIEAELALVKGRGLRNNTSVPLPGVNKQERGISVPWSGSEKAKPHIAFSAHPINFSNADSIKRVPIDELLLESRRQPSDLEHTHRERDPQANRSLQTNRDLQANKSLKTKRDQQVKINLQAHRGPMANSPEIQHSSASRSTVLEDREKTHRSKDTHLGINLCSGSIDLASSDSINVFAIPCIRKGSRERDARIGHDAGCPSENDEYSLRLSKRGAVFRHNPVPRGNDYEGDNSVPRGNARARSINDLQGVDMNHLRSTAVASDSSRHWKRGDYLGISNESVQGGCTGEQADCSGLWALDNQTTTENTRNTCKQTSIESRSVLERNSIRSPGIEGKSAHEQTTINNTVDIATTNNCKSARVINLQSSKTTPHEVTPPAKVDTLLEEFNSLVKGKKQGRAHSGAAHITARDFAKRSAHHSSKNAKAHFGSLRSLSSAANTLRSISHRAPVEAAVQNDHPPGAAMGMHKRDAERQTNSEAGDRGGPLYARGMPKKCSLKSGNMSIKMDEIKRDKIIEEDSIKGDKMKRDKIMEKDGKVNCSLEEGRGEDEGGKVNFNRDGGRKHIDDCTAPNSESSDGMAFSTKPSLDHRPSTEASLLKSTEGMDAHIKEPFSESHLEETTSPLGRASFQADIASVKIAHKSVETNLHPPSIKLVSSNAESLGTDSVLGNSVPGSAVSVEPRQAFSDSLISKGNLALEETGKITPKNKSSVVNNKSPVAKNMSKEANNSPITPQSSTINSYSRGMTTPAVPKTPVDLFFSGNVSKIMHKKSNKLTRGLRETNDSTAGTPSSRTKGKLANSPTRQMKVSDIPALSAGRGSELKLTGIRGNESNPSASRGSELNLSASNDDLTAEKGTASSGRVETPLRPDTGPSTRGEGLRRCMNLIKSKVKLLGSGSIREQGGCDDITLVSEKSLSEKNDKSVMSENMRTEKKVRSDAFTASQNKNITPRAEKRENTREGPRRRERTSSSERGTVKVPVEEVERMLRSARERKEKSGLPPMYRNMPFIKDLDQELTKYTPEFMQLPDELRRKYGRSEYSGEGINSESINSEYPRGETVMKGAYGEKNSMALDVDNSLVARKRCGGELKGVVWMSKVRVPKRAHGSQDASYNVRGQVSFTEEQNTSTGSKAFPTEGQNTSTGSKESSKNITANTQEDAAIIQRRTANTQENTLSKNDQRINTRHTENKLMHESTVHKQDATPRKRSTLDRTLQRSSAIREQSVNDGDRIMSNDGAQLKGSCAIGGSPETVASGSLGTGSLSGINTCDANDVMDVDLSAKDHNVGYMNDKTGNMSDNVDGINGTVGDVNDKTGNMNDNVDSINDNRGDMNDSANYNPYKSNNPNFIRSTDMSRITTTFINNNTSDISRHINTPVHGADPMETSVTGGEIDAVGDKDSATSDKSFEKADKYSAADDKQMNVNDTLTEMEDKHTETDVSAVYAEEETNDAPESTELYSQGDSRDAVAESDFMASSQMSLQRRKPRGRSKRPSFKVPKGFSVRAAKVTPRSVSKSGRKIIPRGGDDEK